jgi:hypothetical protein
VAALPAFNDAGDLPAGVHRVSLAEVLRDLGDRNSERRAIADRLERIDRLAAQSGHLARFVIFGSFITAQPVPNDVDVFLLMDDTFDAGTLHGEAAILFNHSWAQAYFGASVFWLRRLAALGGERAAIEHWQIKRDGTRRGIVEVILDDSQ